MEEGLFSAVMDCSLDGIMVWRSIRSASGAIVDFECTTINGAAAEIIGMAREEFVGQRFCEIWPFVVDDGLFARYAQIAVDRTRFVHEWRVSAEPEERWFALSAVGAPEPDDGLVVVFRELTEHRRFTGILSELQDRHEVLERQALHDPLTGLANRLLLETRLEHAVARLDRHESGVAVMFIDLDGFKQINDTYGHPVGDVVLIEIGRRLQQSARVYDTVSRVGGDEFVIVSEDMTNTDAMLRVARRFADVCAQPISVDGIQVAVSASVGVALADTGKERAEDLIADADRAMYRAKARGGGQVEFADDAIGRSAARRDAAERRLAAALVGDELEMWFEPVVRASDRTVTAAEVQLRWPGESTGTGVDRSVGDGTLAEMLADPATSTALIVEVGYHVVRRTVEQAARWVDTFGDRRIVAIVNTRMELLADDAFVDSFLAMLDEFDVGGDRICLGVTESYLMSDDLESAVDTLERLAAAGVILELRGVGAGKNPSRYARRFPISFAELDRTLIDSIGHGGDDIVAAVHDLITSRGAMVVSPGVATQEQFDVLSALGTRLFQGPFVSAPLSLDRFEAFAVEH